MTARTAVLVSHGQPSDPEVGETEIGELADQVGELLPDDWTVRGATLSSAGTLEAAVAASASSAEPTLVYPLFMSDGWFIKTVLPQRLEGLPATVLPPFGLDPAIAELAARWLQEVCDSAGWDEGVQLVVAGHGSGKSTRPAEITETFAQSVAELLPDLIAEHRCGFVEQAPYLADAAAELGARSICLPFFATRRGHMLIDVPEALDQAHFTGTRLDAIGCHPQTPTIIANALRHS